MKRADKTGKITVKHFLNTSLKPDTPINFEQYKDLLPPNVPKYPLYVKITFKRKTTQIKSIADDSFSSMDEAMAKASELIKFEKKEIERTIFNEYHRVGDNFSLKGVHFKIKNYQRDLVPFFIDSYLKDEFISTLFKTRSKFIRFLIYGGFYYLDVWNSTRNVAGFPIMQLYDTSLKLLDNPASIQKLRPKFIIIESLEKCLRKEKDLFDVTVLDWMMGNGKDTFNRAAVSAGLTYAKIKELFEIIDREIEKL